MSKHILSTTEKQILSTLMFRESFQALMEETRLPYGVLRDVLITLISRGLVEVFEDPPSVQLAKRKDTGVDSGDSGSNGQTGSVRDQSAEKEVHIHTSRATAFYDSDNIHQFSFKATKNGLRGIRHVNV